MEINTILVDDNPHIVEGIKKAIRWKKLGVNLVATFVDVFEAKSILERQHINLIITDINMPGLNGLELYREIRKIKRPPVVIFISGYDNFTYAREAVRLGAFDYVEKPIDYDYLERIISKAVNSIREEESNRELLERSIPAMTANFFHDLLHCNSDESRYFLSDSVSYLSIPSSLSHYICSVIKITNDISLRKEMGIDNYHLKLISIQEKFTRALSSFDLTYVIGNRNQFVYVIGSDESVPDLLTGLNRKIEIIIESETERNWFFNIGIGSVQSSIWDLNLSYNDAKQALKYHFFLPQKSIFDIRDYKGKTPAPLFLTSFQESELLRLLSYKDLDGLRVFLNNVSGKLARNFSDTNDIYLFAYDIMTKAMRFLADMSINVDEIRSEMQSFHESLPGFQNLRDLTDQVYHICVKVCRLLDQSSSSYHAKLNERIQDYIKAHFEENDLGLATISAYVNISPSYLSALYKKINGVGISVAISDFRIEMAESLLINSSLSIKSISEKVGFKSQYYFSACFKKKTGKTPTSYREDLVRESIN